MTFSKVYAQDTLLQVESSLIRKLYSDALKYDSCKTQSMYLQSVVGKQDDQIEKMNRLYTSANDRGNKCNEELATTSSERNLLAEENLDLENQVDKKNKWISRLLITAGIEAVVIVLLAL